MADADTPHLHIEFFAEAVQNKARSALEGRPIFEDKEFIRIRFRGDRNRVLVAPANEGAIRHPETNLPWSYKDRFPKHYAAFKAGQAYRGEGTPISELPFLTEAKRAELRALNIHTAESLAGLEGTPLTRLGMGGREMKNQAEAYLAHAASSATDTRFAAENAELRSQIAALQAQFAELAKAQSQPEPAVSPFQAWDDATLKSWIGEKTGTKPKGNPSHATLVGMADEINATATEAA
jgi:hypothetical protein